MDTCKTKFIIKIPKNCTIGLNIILFENLDDKIVSYIIGNTDVILIHQIWFKV